MSSPKIRFKGDFPNWDQKKLNEIGKTFTGLSGKTKEDFGHGEGLFIPYVNIFGNAIVDESKLESVELDDNQNEVKYGDVFFTTSSETPDEVGMSSVRLGNKKNVYLNSFCFGYRLNTKIDYHYLSYMLRSESFRKKMILLAQGISRYNISKNKVMELPIRIPFEGEQIKIGSFFKTFDEQIRENESKLEKLRQLKKSFLQKMFPKEGKTIPEIRFRGFEGDWKKEELNKYLIISNEKNYNNTYGKEDVLSVSGEFGVVNQIEFQGRSFAGASVSNYGIVHKGNVVYTKSPLKANPYGIIKSNKGKTGIVSVLYAIYFGNENCNPDFVQIYFEQDERLNNYLRPLISKGAKNTINVSDEDALKGIVQFPSKDEQDKIAKFFEKLDNQIKYQIDKIEKLKNLKQSLLQKMFI